jgi:hypothetical protein
MTNVATANGSMKQFSYAAAALAAAEVVCLAGTLLYPAFMGGLVAFTIVLTILWLVLVIAAVVRHGATALLLVAAAPFGLPLVGFYLVLAMFVCSFGGC